METPNPPTAKALEEEQPPVPSDLAKQLKDARSSWNSLDLYIVADRPEILASLQKHDQLQQALYHLTQFKSLTETAHKQARIERRQMSLPQQVKTLAMWIIRCLFPSFSHPSVNYCKLNGPVGLYHRFKQFRLHRGGAEPTSWWNAIFTWVGVFIGIALIGILHQYGTSDHEWPILFASHGALATIIFCTPANQVIQPYHSFVGTAVSTTMAVLIQTNMDTTKLLWLAVALSAASAITLMHLLGCVHPPGGALAILYIAVPSLQILGYWYILAAEVGVTIMLLTALIVNNIPKIEARRFPTALFG